MVSVGDSVSPHGSILGGDELLSTPLWWQAIGIARLNDVLLVGSFADRDPPVVLGLSIKSRTPAIGSDWLHTGPVLLLSQQSLRS